MPSVEVTEVLAGRLRLAQDDRERPMVVTIRARTGPFGGFLRRPALAITGVVDAPGLAARRPLEGSIDATRLRASRAIAYAFDFTDDDGAPLAFVGEKALLAGDLLASFTLLVGAIRDARGGLVGEALLRLDLRSDLARLAKSFRVAR